MKLSEAIRLGAMIRPKANGHFFRDGASCAQGAALEASGLPYEEGCAIDCHERMDLLWPWTTRRAVCPACQTISNVRGIIAHLNNSTTLRFGGSHDWTRERIADWVETLEQAHARPEQVDAVDPGVQSIADGLRA